MVEIPKEVLDYYSSMTPENYQQRGNLSFTDNQGYSWMALGEDGGTWRGWDAFGNKLGMDGFRRGVDVGQPGGQPGGADHYFQNWKPNADSPIGYDFSYSSTQENTSAHSWGELLAMLAASVTGIGAVGAAAGVPLGMSGAGAGAGAGGGWMSGVSGEAIAGAGMQGQGLAGTLGGAAGAAGAGAGAGGSGLTWSQILNGAKTAGGLASMLGGGGGGSGGSGGGGGGGGMGLNDIIGMIGGGVDAYKQSDAAEKMLAWLNGNQAKMEGYMNPGSAEYTGMWDEMSRKDAAAGRNSQYGPRTADFLSKVAQAKAANIRDFTTGNSRGYSNALNQDASSLAGLFSNLQRSARNGSLGQVTGTSLPGIFGSLFGGGSGASTGGQDLGDVWSGVSEWDDAWSRAMNGGTDFIDYGAYF